MAVGRFFLPILIAVLLFSQVFARELGEKPAAGGKDVAVKVHDPSLKVHEGELDVANIDEQGNFDDDKHYYSYGYGYKYKGKGYGYEYRYGYKYGDGSGYKHTPYCGYHCGRRCCSAEEYAEFVQDQN